MKTSGFTERPLAHDICQAVVFTFLYARIAMKRKGNSIFIYWANDNTYFFKLGLSTFQNGNFSKVYLVIWFKKSSSKLAVCVYWSCVFCRFLPAVAVAWKIVLKWLKVQCETNRRLVCHIGVTYNCALRRLATHKVRL